MDNGPYGLDGQDGQIDTSIKSILSIQQKKPARNAMKKLFLVLVCLSGSLAHASEKQDPKEAIGEYQERLKKASKKEVGPLQVELAKVYYKDQNLEQAFKVFLEALESPLPSTKAMQPTEVEQKLYEEALEIYLDHPGIGATQAARKIEESYERILSEHSDYHLLNFLLAAAYANLGKFEEFFDHFYSSYIRYPDNFMGYKTKAVLHIKLFEKARIQQEREKQRRAVLENALKAQEKNKQDTSLYKLIIAFSDEKDKGEAIEKSLNEILENEIKIPRTEIYFFVKEAVEHNKATLAQRLVDKAREWYAYSRSLDAAQKLIDQSEGK